MSKILKSEESPPDDEDLFLGSKKPSSSEDIFLTPTNGGNRKSNFFRNHMNRVKSLSNIGNPMSKSLFDL